MATSETSIKSCLDSLNIFNIFKSETYKQLWGNKLVFVILVYIIMLQLVRILSSIGISGFVNFIQSLMILKKIL